MDTITKLRKAVAVEAQAHYTNVRGRERRFAEFVTVELALALEAAPVATRAALIPLCASFQRYETLTGEERARVVGDLVSALPQLTPPPAEAAPAGREKPPPLDPDGDWRDKPVQYVKGIGPRIASLLAKVRVETVDDLLRYYPRKHLDYAQRVRIGTLKPGASVTVWGEIKKVEAYNPPGAKGLSVITVWVTDGTGTVAARWFGRKAGKYQLDRQKARFPVGDRLLMSGEPKLDKYSGRIVFDRPEVELLGAVDEEEGRSLQVGRIVPVYDLTDGLNAKLLRKSMRAALDLYLPLVRDPLPAEGAFADVSPSRRCGI